VAELLQEIGLLGKMLSVLEAMYRDVRGAVCELLKGSRIIIEEHLGGPAGLPKFSSLLFNLYVDPFEKELSTEDATDEIDGV
jgi:hypothetical protein